MAVNVSARITITRPRAVVARYATNPEHDTAWIGGIREVEVLDGGPVARGSQVRRVAYFLGRRIEYVNEIDALEPESLLDMHSVRAPFPMRVTYRFEDNGSGTTEVTILVRGKPGGLFRLAGPLLGPMVRRNVRGDLARLKQILESQA